MQGFFLLFTGQNIILSSCVKILSVPHFLVLSIFHYILLPSSLVLLRRRYHPITHPQPGLYLAWLIVSWTSSEFGELTTNTLVNRYRFQIARTLHLIRRSTDKKRTERCGYPYKNMKGKKNAIENPPPAPLLNTRPKSPNP